MESLLASVIILMIFLAIPGETLAQQRGWGWYKGMPYGQYCPHGRWGGAYGERRPVATADEAKKVIENYFAERKMVVRVGKIEERRWFFIAEILDKEGTLVDQTIVDKRTGRIRSIY